jgi:hypothetical protein
VASGNGIGKTALLTWLILCGLITYEDCLSVITAGSEGQLRTRLASELATWHARLPQALKDQFVLEATSLFNKQNQRTWRADLRPWTERNQEAFSGLHNLGKRVLVVFDECSMIPTAIWRATEAMLSDAETQIIWAVFGNPLRLDGRFPMCFPGGRFSGLWKSFQVDSREVTLTNKEAIAEKLLYYGVDSNYARSHVLGQFPTASTEQLIPLDLVEAACAREAFQHPGDSVVLGCDVASGRSEDSSVIVVRRGLDARSYPIQKFATLDPIEFSYRIAAVANEVNADAVFIDATGLGEGTVAKLRELGLPSVHAVYFAGKSDNPSGLARAANKRAECWLALRDWLRAGAIPRDSELMAQLASPEYSEVALGILLERKSDMRARGLASPDVADALALTFATKVFSQLDTLSGPGDHRVSSEYDPFSDDALAGRPIPELTRRYTAPGWSSLKERGYDFNDWAIAIAC